ncbi:hypothetical protein BABA_01550 [Neobacillus bataviensis LMG 21833]|uniref:Peptidoglycan binding-like domain-containing protein n=1 Tax=Neobacillus bataviensis LMG 21833 TaxID=1117379 RepID=K6ED01_9BACI|nr:peptidoglycan-binding protein [Neobacillus bataviensis]EKN71326.1 hypothetical protein BABA_01550 [Neobacillus bataviensis LMG 21833]
MVQHIVGVTADGTFGKDTEVAVKSFQKRHWSSNDGIV